METLKEIILKAFKEGKTIQSRDGNEWKDFIRQNQLDTPNLDYRGIDNWRIKPEPIQSNQTLIEKLEAEKKELLEALERSNMAMMDCDWSENEGAPHLIPIYKSNQSLIQKHKQ